MEILIISLILLFLISLILIYICNNLYKKVSIYEPTIEYYETFYTKFAELLTFVNAKLMEVDNRGSFSADDEIGFAYKSIKSLWKLLIDMGLQVKEEETSKINTNITVSQLKNLPSVRIVKNIPVSDSRTAITGKQIM